MTLYTYTRINILLYLLHELINFSTLLHFLDISDLLN